MEEEVRICDCCGAVIEENEDYSWVGDDIVCDDCRRDEGTTCIIQVGSYQLHLHKISKNQPALSG